MDSETFRKAVDSLQDYPHMVGIIGGEPTLHPRFEEFVEYIRTKRIGVRREVIRYPIDDMMGYIRDRLGHSEEKIGLWSSLSLGYYKNFEIINDTFKKQVLNDHENTCRHQALLMPRKDLGITDEEWKKKRESCWIQNKWSATITPKGAFFCEVAGALNMLFHGEEGWPIEPGWWKRTPEDFKDQLRWCELCSACLDVPKRVSSEEKDDITYQMYERLKKLDSPKINKKMYIIHKPGDFDASKNRTFTTGSEYIDSAGGKRISKNNRNLYPKMFVVAKWDEAITVFQNRMSNDWIIFSDNEESAEAARRYFHERIINPGCMYCYRDAVAIHISASSLRDITQHPEDLKLPISQYYPLDKIIYIDPEFAEEEEKIRRLLLRCGAGKRIVIHGAGIYGKKVLSMLISRSDCTVCGFIDRNHENMEGIVQSPNILQSLKYDVVLVAVKNRSVYKEISNELNEMNIDQNKILWIMEV